MLYVARHGETDWNVEKRFQARVDVPLNENGRRQARALRTLFTRRGVRFVDARCSPLARAVETLHILLEDDPVPHRPEAALLELALGEYEGRLEAEIRAAEGEAFDRWRETGFRQAAPGGESIADGIARVRPLLDELRAVASESDVLLVAHQAINIAIKAALSGRDDDAALAAFKQANDEVDICDPLSGVVVERLRGGEPI